MPGAPRCCDFSTDDEFRDAIFAYVDDAAGPKSSVLTVRLAEIARCAVSRLAVLLMEDGAIDQEGMPPRGPGLHACPGAIGKTGDPARKAAHAQWRALGGCVEAYLAMGAATRAAMDV